MNFCTRAAWKWPGSRVTICTLCLSSRAVAAWSSDAVAAMGAVSTAARTAAVSFHRFLIRPASCLRECQRAVRRAFIPREHGIGLGIVPEPAGLVVPLEGTPEFHGDPADDAGGVAVVAHACRRERRLARLDALQPVQVMRLAHGQLHGQAIGIQKL